MAMLCLFGVCIPYSVIWPVLVLFLKEVWTYFMGKSAKEEKAKSVTSTNMSTTTTTTVATGYLGNLESEEQWTTILQSGKLTFAKFTATWCKPCKATEPVYAGIAREQEDRAIFVNVDVDEHDKIAAENKAIAIPLVVCFKNGERVDSFTGKDPDQLTLFVNDMLELHGQQQ
jgi:thioredoxin 1